MFELLTPHKSTFLKHDTLSQKNRPADELPGVKITVKTQFSADLLQTFLPKVHALLFEAAPTPRAKPAQPELDGVPEKPVAKWRLTTDAISLDKLKWKPELSGYTVQIIRGTGRAAANAVVLKDCIVHIAAIEAKEPDQCLAKFVVESGNIPDEHWPLFSKLKSREFDITLTAPEKDQRDLLAENEAREFEKGVKNSLASARKPGAAEKAAVAKVKGGKAEPPKGKPAKGAAVSKDGAWPFPKGEKPDGEAPPQGVTVERSQPGTRTARGRDATKAFLDAQKKESAGKAAAAGEATS